MARAASWLEQDPDERIVRWGWMIWVAWGVIGGALFLNDVKGGTGALSLILVAPFWGMWLLWPTYRFIRAMVALAIRRRVGRMERYVLRVRRAPDKSSYAGRFHLVFR